MHKNNSLMLKSQQKFRSEKHNIFTEKLHKTALSFNDSKGIKSIDSAETYTYRTKEEIIQRKEESNCDNVIKRYQKWLTMTMLQMKTWTNMI